MRFEFWWEKQGDGRWEADEEEEEEEEKGEGKGEQGKAASGGQQYKEWEGRSRRGGGAQ